MKTQKEIIQDPKYDPPYPQNFYRFWPRHALKVWFVVAITFGIIVLSAYYFRVPTDPNMPPLPDEGAYIPAPDWYLLFVYQPFWYLTGEKASLLPLGTFWLPLAIGSFLVLVPFLFGRKKTPGYRMALYGKIAVGLFALTVWGIGMAGVVGSGYPAKTTGCLSCHNFMMGIRQALPPADIGKYYREVRKHQIEVGKYKIGDSAGVGQSYKDANWQLRHFYEPTMTW